MISGVLYRFIIPRQFFRALCLVPMSLTVARGGGGGPQLEVLWLAEPIYALSPLHV